MKKFLVFPLSDQPDALMQKAGYVRHCVEHGRVCYHRNFSESVFPRFHAYIAMYERGMEIDLHFDQKNLHHDSNHKKDWAYSGGRVDGEMRRMLDVICGKISLGEINHPITC